MKYNGYVKGTVEEGKTAHIVTLNKYICEKCSHEVKIQALGWGRAVPKKCPKCGK